MTELLDRVDVPQRRTRPVHRPGPRRRPPVGLRIVAGLLGLVATAFAAALMLSDRAPGILRQMFGDAARRLWERVDASGRAEFVTADQVPESDHLLHIAVWATVMLLVGVAIWSWRWLIVASPTVVGVSAFIEAGQARWADTRTVEASDVVANTMGVTLGVAAVIALYLLWSGAAALLRPDSSR